MRPWTVVLCTFLMSAICGLGMIRFELKDSSAPIWIPENSAVLQNQEWVEDNFPLKYRYNLIIITADNVLSPDVLKQVRHYGSTDLLQEVRAMLVAVTFLPVLMPININQSN